MPRHLETVERQTEGERLLQLRERLGASQREMAREFQVTSGAIALWESGQRTVPGPVLRLIALYEEELDPVDAGLRPPLRTGWAERSTRAGTAQLSWFFTRMVFGKSAPGSVGRRLRDHALRQYIDAASRLKGVQLKWAQLAWNMDLLLEEDERDALQTLAHAAPVLSPAQAAQVFFEEFGVTPRRAFARWAPEPVASGSVGQVHAAQLSDGRRVAVKIQYPNIAEVIRADGVNLRLLDGASRLLLRSQTPGVFHEELCERFLEECDYSLEARAQTLFASLLQGCEGLHIPGVVQDWTRGRVLTSEYAEGVTLAQLCATASPAEKDRAGEVLWRFYYESILKHGLFNADPNPGNLLFNSGGVTFLDFGRIKRLSPGYLAAWKRMGRALLERDRDAFRTALLDTGYVPKPEGFDFEHAFRLIRLWTRPCLTDEPFEYTPGFLRTLWRAFVDDPTRSRVNYTRDTVFLNQLLFGVTNILAHLGARLQCRGRFLSLLYAPGERLPAPYSAGELAQIEA